MWATETARKSPLLSTYYTLSVLYAFNIYPKKISYLSDSVHTTHRYARAHVMDVCGRVPARWGAEKPSNNDQHTTKKQHSAALLSGDVRSVR